MTCSAELLSLKRHEIALKLPVLLPGSREHELLLSMGPYRTFRTAYSAAPAVTKKDTISCVVELGLQTFKCGAGYVDQVEGVSLAGGFHLTGVF